MAEEPKILIIDAGSQYTLVIGRILRELGHRSIVLSPKQAKIWLMTNHPVGIILSGGPAGVGDNDAPMIPESILTGRAPILGICYGMQWLGTKLQGSISQSIDGKHYGEETVELDVTNPLFEGLDSSQLVWMSHGDCVTGPNPMPSLGFNPLGTAENGTIIALQGKGTQWYGVQFHPEVVQTPNGGRILQNFLKICEAKRDWNPVDTIEEIRKLYRGYSSEVAVAGYSGGVDSSVMAAMFSSVFGRNLHLICIDAGQLREKELDEVRANAAACGVKVKIIRAKGRFLKALAGETDAEKKRAKFSRVYRDILQEEAYRVGARIILQGSLATDFIETGTHEGSASKKIKRHHNSKLKFHKRFLQLHPLRHLFKYEVRDLARALGLPLSIVDRQPYPGPGSFIRICGKPVTRKRLKTLRWADAVTRKILLESGVSADISQTVVALNCVPTVGVKGDKRTYADSVIVRAVQTADFMTAIGYQIPAEIRRKICQALTKHPRIVRVFFDETDKPPATTEME